MMMKLFNNKNTPFATVVFQNVTTFDARHLIKNFFARPNQCRAIAMRCDKNARNFLNFRRLTAVVVWLN